METGLVTVETRLNLARIYGQRKELEHDPGALRGVSDFLMHHKTLHYQY